MKKKGTPVHRTTLCLQRPMVSRTRCVCFLAQNARQRDSPTNPKRPAVVLKRRSNDDASQIACIYPHSSGPRVAADAPCLLPSVPTTGGDARRAEGDRGRGVSKGRGHPPHLRLKAGGGAFTLSRKPIRIFRNVFKKKQVHRNRFGFPENEM